MNMSITRRAATMGLAAAALTTGAFAGAAPASASTAPSVTANETQAVASVFQASSERAGWHYYKSYFWGKDCNAKGNSMINSGKWKAYRCVGDWRNDYQLWYQR